MPAGASIVQGVGTEPNVGFRKPLRDHLRFREFGVNMVGCNSNGNFRDNQHEGYPPHEWKPNVVLVNAGTNDAIQADQRGQDTKDVNEIFRSSDNVVIILSTLLPHKVLSSNANAETINTRLRQLVRDLALDGAKIRLAEMNNGFLDLETDMAEDTQPNTEGFRKVAAVWAQAIETISGEGWIGTPIGTGRPDDGSGSGGQCLPNPGNFRGPVRTQVGSGYEDGTYTHSSQPQSAQISHSFGFHDFKTYSFSPAVPIQNIHFANLVNNGQGRGEETDDFILVRDPDQRCFKDTDFCLPQLQIGVNSGGSFPSQLVDIDVGTECLNRGIRWGDVNGDGLDDFICINLEGNIWASINISGNPPRFEFIGFICEKMDWAPQASIRLADIDENGRMDFCTFDGKGDVYYWRNGGVGKAPTEKYGGYWQGMIGGAPTFNAKGIPGIEGDSRADWVYVFVDGSTRIFINQRENNDNDPAVRVGPKFVVMEFSIATCPEMATMIISSYGRRIKMFGNKQSPPSCDVLGEILATGRIRKSIYFGDWNGDGKCDVISVDKNTGDLTGWGVGLQDLGLRFADIDGDGRVDYLCTEPNGRTTGHLNTKDGLINMNQIKFSDRANHRWADIDGDGKADFLWIDKFTGNVRVWINKGKIQAGDSAFTWEKRDDQLWMNGPDRGANSDDGSIANPNLPTPSPVICPRSSGNAHRVVDGCDLEPSQNQINIALIEFPRIDWTEIAKWCNSGQFDHLFSASKRMRELYREAGTAWDRVVQTTGFNRYFARVTQWQETGCFSAGKHKWEKTWEWFDNPGRDDRLKTKITYFRNSPSWMPKQSTCAGGTPGTAAFTHRTGLNDPRCEVGINLLPNFWKFKRVDEVTEEAYRQISDLDSMHSTEEIMIHEWFHIFQTDFSSRDNPTQNYHVIDVEDYTRGDGTTIVRIYGPFRTHDYAWTRIGAGLDGQFMEKTMTNADSFTHMMMYKHFESRYGWLDDGSWKGSKKRRGIKGSNTTIAGEGPVEGPLGSSLWRRISSILGVAAK
ncbi:hypothetical protein BCR34DRAFT_598855 [Clohesyomyces aquaticus]|uniref:SGNH hydrolase-type esterase domain-containing protein n=1 Tax=Clohesyomyces aquaticus TaxID=1231657 RepID=A0A1Y1ZXM2_9PLEO|nr:hypothetical protein BCR34DRAFT_598855 [Clohesyomyces aquaticus]